MSVERLRRAGALAACAATGLAVAAGPAAQAQGHAAGAPTVQEMIVGAGNVILAPARTVTVPQTTVGVGGRSCGVAAGTPLAALVALRRVGGPAFALHDYGHCGSSVNGSGELFVYSLDGETNHGQNGWEYKVEGRSGTTGAGDPSGPFGDGRRLGDGERVLWFWCQAFAGGCQRTLQVGAPAAVAPGATLTATVWGDDNEGRARAMSGATVRVGHATARTGGSGRATLRAPGRPGRYALSAARPGSVPSFPETITVR